MSNEDSGIDSAFRVGICFSMTGNFVKLQYDAENDPDVFILKMFGDLELGCLGSCLDDTSI